MAGKPVADGWAWYRPWLWATLIWLTVAGVILAGSIPGWADSSDDDPWPKEIYFPQKASHPPVASKVQTGSTTGSTGPGTEKEKPKGKGIWPFRKDPAKRAQMEAEKHPPTDEQITQVGPHDPPPYPDPLLRLMFPIRTETGMIQPGFYLVRQLEKQEQGRTLLLTRQHEVLFKFNVTVAKDAPESPIEPNDRTAPLKLSMEAILSPDQKTMTLVLVEGTKRYESQAFPTGTDTRSVLTH